MRVLTVRQPWAWAILHAGKDVENRAYPTTTRGRIGIHAGRRYDWSAFEFLRRGGIDVPEPDELPTGVIVCTTVLGDCVRDSHSRWARPDMWHWTLRDTREVMPAIPHRGAMSMTTNATLDALHA